MPQLKHLLGQTISAFTPELARLCTLRKDILLLLTGDEFAFLFFSQLKAADHKPH